MPRLVWCLDNYFEEKKKDCYFVVFGRKFPITPDDSFIVSENPPGRDSLLEWFKSNYSHINVIPIWPHHSESFSLFFQMNYDGSVAVEFDSESLEAFCDFWEDENKNGVSKDGSFTCYVIPYESYIANSSGY